MNTRVLVLGATGMLGHACVATFCSRFDTHASVRDADRIVGDTGAELHGFDVWSDPIEELLSEARPDVVVNCIGIVKQLRDAERPRVALRVNSLFPHELAEGCEATGIRLIHISTDCVFSGRQPLGSRYTEDTQADPVDLYGLSKLAGEVHEPMLTLRTSIIGPELERRVGLLEWFRAQAGNTVTGYSRALFSGVTTIALAELLAALIEDHHDLRGLYHVASEPISKYDLLHLLRGALRIDCEIIESSEPVVNRALDPTRFLAATNLNVPSWEEMVKIYKEPAANVTAA
jgi:dTDP-4-dehydrorhamnose reductase